MENQWQPSKSRSIKRRIRRRLGSLLEVVTNILNPDPLRPPRSLLHVNRTAYDRLGPLYKELFIKEAGLLPDHKLLDVGCGTGRMAVPLVKYLSVDGQYWGLDIQKEVIQWCQGHISSRYKQFHFIHADIYNQRYNPKGKVQAKEFKFPFEAGCFDLVILISVFSHMLPADTQNYLKQISQVLKPGGTCLATFFLYDQQTQEHLRLGPHILDFRYKGDNYLASNPDMPELGLAYDKSYIEQLFTANKLSIKKVLHGTTILGKLNFLSAQDIVIATRKE